MFAIDHAATALLVKRRFPSVPMAPLLVSVQAMELAWVTLNYLGVERTTTESTVRSVADIHLAYMPFSHSVGTAIIAIGNLANLSFLSPAIPGPESYLAGRPLLLVTVVFVQIVVTLVLVGVLARRTDFKSSAALLSAVGSQPGRPHRLPVGRQAG